MPALFDSMVSHQIYEKSYLSTQVPVLGTVLIGLSGFCHWIPKSRVTPHVAPTFTYGFKTRLMQHKLCPISIFQVNDESPRTCTTIIYGPERGGLGTFCVFIVVTRYTLEKNPILKYIVVYYMHIQLYDNNINIRQYTYIEGFFSPGVKCATELLQGE